MLVKTQILYTNPVNYVGAPLKPFACMIIKAIKAIKN
jgi:hypothetical protein